MAKERKHLTPSEWTECLNKYKTGDYLMQDLADEYGISHDAIQKKAHELGITKGELLDKGLKVLENKYLQAFKKQGIDEDKVAEIVTDFLLSEKRDPENHKKKVPDRYSRDLGLKHYEKLTGADKPQDDKNTTTQVPQIKILIMSKDGEISTNLTDSGIKF